MLNFLDQNFVNIVCARISFSRNKAGVVRASKSFSVKFNSRFY